VVVVEELVDGDVDALRGQSGWGEEEEEERRGSYQFGVGDEGPGVVIVDGRLEVTWRREGSQELRLASLTWDSRDAYRRPRCPLAAPRRSTSA
jgi:hypothetical protein